MVVLALVMVMVLTGRRRFAARTKRVVLIGRGAKGLGGE
jgi:hypothetical protein